MTTASENLVERKVTYTLEYEGKFYIIENVPALVNEETPSNILNLKLLRSCKKLFYLNGNQRVLLILRFMTSINKSIKPERLLPAN